MTRVILTDLVSGGRLLDVPHKTCKWEDRLNRAESLDVQVTLRDPLNVRLDISNAAAVAKSVVGIIENDRMVGCGPIWDHDYDQDTKQLDLSADGWMSLLARRRILPVAAMTQPLILQSGENAGQPNPATNTVFVGKSWPYIVRTLLQQSMAWPGAGLPFVFGPDGVGSHDKSYNGSDLKDIASALEDLMNLDNGPEIRFEGRLRPDGMGIEVYVRVSDDSNLELTSTTTHQFDFTAPKRTVRQLKVSSSGRKMASQYWGTGGRQAGEAIVSRAYSSSLTDRGYPFMEDVDSSHSTVELQPTLDSYQRTNLILHSAPTEFWSFEAKTDAVPYVGEYQVGDHVLLITPNGDPFIPAGRHPRRIVGLSGDQKNRWVKITTDEVLTDG